MRKYFIILIVMLFFYSCIEKRNTEEIKGKAIPSDTVLFKYVLGDNSALVKKHTDSLILSKDISPKTTKIFTLSLMGEKANFIVEGYPCVIYIENDSINSIMNLVMYNDSLLRQEFYLYNNSIPYSALTDLYGKSTTVKEYPVDSKSNIRSFWILGDKAIYTAEFANNYYLYFEKMSLKRSMAKKLKEEENEKKERDQKSNKEKSKDLGW